MVDWFLETGLYVVGAVLLPVVGVLLVYFGVWGDRSKGRVRCPACWYDMRGTVPRLECPECGHAPGSESELHRDRRDWWRIVIGAVLVLASGYPLTVTIRRMAASGPPATLAFWYDMGTGQLYGATGIGFPPMVAPSGGEGVKAVVYAARDCADPKDRFVVYLWKLTAQTKQAMLNWKPDPSVYAHPRPEILIKTPNEAKWVLRDPAERYELIAAAEAKRGVKLTRCGRFE